MVGETEHGFMFMAKIIVLIGAPGAGKGTQARLLESNLGIPHISTGDMLRDIQTTDTKLKREIKAILASGELVSDNTIFRMVKERTSREDCQGNYILDGFPRTPIQAKMLEELSKEQSKEISAILLDVPSENLEKRLTGRRICPICGEIYNIYYKAPKFERYCDMHPHAELSHRSDDAEEKVKVRLEKFKETTKSVLAYYERSGRLQRVKGVGTPNKIYERLERLVAANNVTA